MQPLSPKHQPWFRRQAPYRKLASANLSRSPTEQRLFGAPAQTVEQELVLRARIEQRAAEKLEKLHEAVSHDRFVRVSATESKLVVLISLCSSDLISCSVLITLETTGNEEIVFGKHGDSFAVKFRGL